MRRYKQSAVCCACEHFYLACSVPVETDGHRDKIWRSVQRRVIRAVSPTVITVNMLRLRQEVSLSNLTLRHPRPYRFVSAQCDHRVLYGCWRVFWAGYHITWVLLSWVLEPWVTYPTSERVKWFIYLTNWTYLLLSLQTLLETVTFFTVHMWRKDIVREKGPVEMPWYLKLQWTVYNVVTTGSFMVTAWYWAAVYKGDKEIGAVRISLHAINSVYVLLNLLVTATPTRLLHCLHPVLFGVVYTVFSAVYFLAGGSNVKGEPYIYRVIDWSKPGKTILASCLSNFLAIPTMHLSVFMLRIVVEKLWRCWRGSGKRGGQRDGTGRTVGGVTCVDLMEKGTESSSVQGELLVDSEG